MKEFNIYVQNRVGALASVCEALAKRGVNITALATESVSKSESISPDLKRSEMTTAMIRLVTSDEMTTRKALDAESINYTETEILPISMIDRPGELAKVARKLSNAGVWIESVYILGTHEGKTDIAFTVDSIQKAKDALKK